MNNFRMAKIIIVFSSLSYLSVSFLRNYNSPENIEKRCILKFEKDFKNNYQMINSMNLNHLPIQDLVVSGLIIFMMSTIIANIYDPLLGITYAFGNILTLTFLSWLYKETWSDPRK